MKAINFLFVLVLGTCTISSAQENQQVLDNDSIVRIREMMARVDSLKPASDPAVDSALVLKPKTDSIHDSTATVAAAITALPQTGKHNTLPINFDGMDPTLFYSIVIGVGLLLLGLLFLILYSLLTSKTSKEIRSTLSNLFKRGDRIAKLKDKLERKTLRQQIATMVANAGVDRKKYAMEKLIGAFMTECKITLKSGLSVEDTKMLMDQILEKLLESRLYLRFDWRPVYRIFGMLMGIALIIVLILWALKPSITNVVNNVTNTLPGPIVTPTVTVVKVPDVEKYVPISGHFNPPPANYAKADTFYIPAPLGVYGPMVKIENGYQYQFYPLDEVGVLPETGTPFRQKPGEDLGHRTGQSRQYTSYCGHDTQVMEIRTRI